jgi:putative oxidoreductase
LRFLDRMQPLALLAMRLTLGVIMTAHGSQKVFGGLHQFANTVHGMGLPAWLAYVAAFTELICGLMILVGFFTRAAAFAVCIDLIVAIWKVHLHNGFFVTPGRFGYEFTLAAATIAFALIFLGGGPIALDHVLRGGGTGSGRRS